jgi:hypothetical protein
MVCQPLRKFSDRSTPSHLPPTLPRHDPENRVPENTNHVALDCHPLSAQHPVAILAGFVRPRRFILARNYDIRHISADSFLARQASERRIPATAELCGKDCGSSQSPIIHIRCSRRAKCVASPNFMYGPTRHCCTAWWLGHDCCVDPHAPDEMIVTEMKS